MTAWQIAERLVEGEIMRTDVYCQILCPQEKLVQGEAALDIVFRQFRDFEKNYSRFQQGNALWDLNESEGGPVSTELFRMLERAKEFHAFTEGIFDPTLLPALEREGYHGAYTNQVLEAGLSSAGFATVTLDPFTQTVSKPQTVKIDLGGIGKGFIVDAVAKELALLFENFLIDAGGDIFAKGVNGALEYPYWAVDVEHPLNMNENVATLLLSGKAVATSGMNRRRWKKGEVEKHHLIDPRTGASAESDLVSVTVVAADTVTAEIWAKTLFIASPEARQRFIQKYELAAILVDRSGQADYTQYIHPYVWKDIV